MGFFTNAFAKIKTAIRGAAGLSLAPMYGLGLFYTGVKASNAKLMSEAVNWVFSCISRVSETVISERLRLYRKTGAGPEDWTEITDHPFLDLLQKPNKWMPGSDLMQTWSQHEDLTGNAYWLLDGVVDETSEPTAIYPLNPAYMTVKVGAVEGEPDQIVEFWYQPGAVKKIFKPFEIMHFRRTNPNDPFRGLGPTEGSMDSIDTDNWMREWNRRFFQNSAIPGVVLETDNTSAEMIRLLRESFEDRHGGVERAHKTVALPKGVKLAKMGYGQKEMDFVEAQGKNRDSILAAFGVTPIVLGLGMGERGLNRATAEVQEYVFAKYTVKPKLKRFECYVNEFFISRWGDDLAIAFDDCVPKNVEQEITINKEALGGAPYMTVNEVRAKQGLDPIDGGDVLPQPRPTGGVPSDVPAKAIVYQKKAQYVRGIPLRLPMVSKTMRKQADTKEAITGAVMQAVKDFNSQLKKKSIENLTSIDWVDNWKAFVDRTIVGEGKMKSTMETYAKEMTDRAVAALKKKKSIKVVNASKLLNREDEVAAIINTMEPIYLEILKKEGISAAKLVDAAFDESEAKMRAALQKSIDLMAQNYTDTTLKALQDAMEAGLADGGGIDVLTEKIQEVGIWSEATRAETVARTEAFRTANFATKEAWVQSGVVKSIKWYTAEDERVCEDCAAMDGKIVATEDNFMEKGDFTASGVEISYADVGGGSLHVNCVKGDTEIVAANGTALTKARYSGDLIKFTFADGRTLSVTPNHLIATPTGFRVAHLLKEGDDFIDCSALQGVVLSPDPNADQSPTVIEKVFASLTKCEGVLTRTVPATAKDLHSDGRFVDGNIDIIPTDSLLAGDGISVLPQHVRESIFSGTSFSRPLSSDGDFATVLLAMTAATDGIVSSDSIPSILGSGSLAHHKTIRQKLTANYDTRLAQASIDDRSTDVEDRRELICGISALVTINKIVSVERYAFHGDVYDVSTLETSYIANGILSSNCRCSIAPEQIEI